MKNKYFFPLPRMFHLSLIFNWNKHGKYGSGDIIFLQLLVLIIQLIKEIILFLKAKKK